MLFMTGVMLWLGVALIAASACSSFWHGSVEHGLSKALRVASLLVGVASVSIAVILML